MKSALTFLVSVAGIVNVQALVISEIMSNPTGTDNGREWIELYNDTQDPIALAGFSVSTSETGTAIGLTPIQGGTVIQPGGHAVIATIVSGQTKFLEDYPSYTGILLRVSSTFSLTNGSASLFVRSGSSVVASVPSYAAADEGKTRSLVGGSYVTGTPTPGVENQTAESETGSTGTISATTTATQVTVTQTAPSSDIAIYLSDQKVAVAGAETEFAAFSQTRAGKSIDNLRYSWSFGDGGQGTGSSTKYTYAYSGFYVAFVEASNGSVFGTARTLVKVLAPDIMIKNVGTGKYGTYIDIENPNMYDLDLSQWRISIDGAGFPFPKHTLIPAKHTTRFSGIAMGFASSTVSTSTRVQILFPNLEEVTSYSVPVVESILTVGSTGTTSQPIAPLKVAVQTKPQVLGVATVAKPKAKASTTASSTTSNFRPQKDTRLVGWIRGIFK